MPHIKHKKISLKADVGNSALVRPSDWNNDHDIISASSSVYLGQNATGTGPMLELPIVAAPGDDYTMWTKASIQAAITAAITDLHPFATGDVIASIAPSRTGWVLCNGQSLHVSNGPSNHDLFILLWGLNGNTWPVLPTRGASGAEADWTGGKQIAVPDMRGCTLGMIDGGSNVNALIVMPGIKVGIDKVFLTVSQLPTHTHAVPRTVTVGPTLLTGIGGMDEDLELNGVSGATGGDPAATPAFANPVPVNITQPTMAVNFFIKL